MSYRIEPGEPVEDAVRRIALEQIGKARDDVEDDDVGRHDSRALPAASRAVHA